MNYERLLNNLRKYGRDTNFAYVSCHFKPQLRETAKYKQWQRLIHLATWKTFSDTEKQILNSMAVCKVSNLIPDTILEQTQFGQSILSSNSLNIYQYENN